MNESEQVLQLHNLLLNSELYLFPKKGKVDVSIEQGVYIIYNQKGIVLHVGKTDRAKNGLNQRLQNHLRNQSSFSKKYLIPNTVNIRFEGRFKYIEIENDRLRTFTEAFTVGKLCPKHVGTGAKNL